MREVILEGRAAVQWVEALGWAVTPLSSRFQLVADLIRTDTFAIGRIWHTPAHFAFTASTGAPSSMFHSVVGIEGTQVLTIETGQNELAPGQMHVQSFDAPLSITAREPVARLLFVSLWSELQSQGDMPLTEAGHFGSSNAHSEIFTNAVHSALNSVTTIHGAGFSRLRSGLDHLFASVLADDAPARVKPPRGGVADPGDTDASSLPRSLLRRASQLIEARADDVSFDAARLARELGVSSASLYRAYEDSSLTPASQLRTVRARRARSLLASSDAVRAVSTGELRRIATEAGFGSVSSMRRALAGTSDMEVQSAILEDDVRPEDVESLVAENGTNR